MPTTIGAPINKTSGSAPPRRITQKENGAQTTSTTVHISAAAPACDRRELPRSESRYTAAASRGPTAKPPHQHSSVSGSVPFDDCDASPLMRATVSADAELLRQVTR